MEEFCIFMSKSCPWDLITLSRIFILLFEDTFHIERDKFLKFHCWMERSQNSSKVSKIGGQPCYEISRKLKTLDLLSLF